MTHSVLISGATGYIGRLLIKKLSQDPTLNLRCTARNPQSLAPHIPDTIPIVQADFATDQDTSDVFQGIDTAFFLIHALGEKKGFEEIEERIAKNFALAAKKAGVKKIIYLGGLVNTRYKGLSGHMRSRLQVGNILRESGIPVITFRASIILGPGSLSFELIRALVERLPVMVIPKWVRVSAQPIFVQDVISYLEQAIHLNTDKNRVYEIGGTSIVSYLDLMKAYAKARNLKRLFIPVPLLTPFLSSLWLGLVTPVYARIGRKLIQSITVPTTVSDTSAQDEFIVPLVDVDTAITQCLYNEDLDIADIKWSNALSATTSSIRQPNQRYHNRIIDTYRHKSHKHAFKNVENLGGDNGWYAANFLWKLRAAIDILVGGVGLRRSKPLSGKLYVGAPLDWWRVEAYTPGEHLRLVAEMKLPGRAWLDFEQIKQDDEYEIVQTVIYDPKGLFGLLYWYTLLPLHIVIFKSMIKKLATTTSMQPFDTRKA
jgi:uncharacterized protein YbjT (DUF2867 family)